MPISPLEVPSRIPPHNLDAERAVLGAVLLEGRETLPRVIELLRRTDFYTEAHRTIYETMLRLFDRGEPVDLITLSEELRRIAALEAVGGPAALALLVEHASIAAHLGSYATIVRDMAVLRELIQTSTQIITQAFDAKEDVQSLVDDAERRIFGLAERRLEGSALPVGRILKNTFEYIERLYERKEHVTGVATGFEKLDLETSGLQPSDFVIIAGRPSMGKTAFCLNIAQHVGIVLGGKVLFLSLEMSAPQLVQRMLCSEAKVDSQGVRTGRLSASDWHRLTAAAGRLSEAAIFIDDSPGLTVLEARAKARRMKAEHGLDLLVIDYLQLMRGRASMESRQQEISEISRSLKALAKELNVPVVALSQLSRAVESRATRDFRPQLSDLRECVTGDTLVLLADGQRRPIGELVGATPEVLAMHGTGSIAPAKSERIWKVGVRPVFLIRLASGRMLRATAQHRLFSGQGWVTVSGLAVGDRLAVARRLPEPAARDAWRDLRVALMGQLFSGNFGQRSHQKRIPRAAFMLSNRQIALLLRRLWATHGTIAVRRHSRGSHGVSYSTNRPGASTNKPGYRPSFFVPVSGASQLRRFLDTVGAFGPRRAQAERLKGWLAARKANTNVDTVPLGDVDRVRALTREKGLSTGRMAALRGTAYRGGVLRSRATDDLFWDRIVAISPDGEAEVFDLTVPGPASWLADGIVSHNSGALEQDADLILFLYRPSVYKEDLPPDEANITELIIGKQRNGPVGTVKVVFLPQYARFENVADLHRQPQPF
ncbi:MAG TPA: replicative DNA helicase [Methylomirabilota bacterium]|nr:replicative DNA helicase [Methylomirabilota bacterium]